MKRTARIAQNNLATRRRKFVARLLSGSSPNGRPSLSHALRRALSVSLVIIILAVQAPAAPQIIMGVGAQWRADAALWLNASGWVAKLGALLTGTQKPAPGRQAAQAQRNARVSRIQISPGDVTIKEGEQIDFAASALDSDDAPVSGVRFKWQALDVGRSRPVRMRDGRFVARRPGTFQVVAEGARQQATVTVQVLASEDRQKRQDQPGIQKTVSSRDDEPEVASRRVKRPTRGRDDASAPGSFKITNASFARTAAAPPPALVPLIDPEAGWGDGNGNHADDPGNRVGNPPGSPDDDGAGSGNFQLSVPVLGLPGRSQSVALGLAYNSLLWSKTNTNEVTYDADRGWPAAGWALGFGKIIGLNTKGSMLVEPDGTRRSFKCDPLYINGSLTNCSGKTLDGSFIEYFTSSWQGVINYGYALYPNGTRIDYGAPANGAIYPVRVTDASGNYVTITYRANHGPNIENIYDTLGRIVQFHYDSAGLLTAITAPDLVSGTRTLVRLQYQNVSLGQSNNYGFAGNIATHVRDANPPALKAIYFPGTNTGYWFGDSDSYSPYGMLMKVVEQRSMSFSGPTPVLPSQGATGQGLISPGTASQQRAYNYPVALGTLTDAPTYTTATLSWANADAGDSQTGYFFLKNATNPSAPTVPSSKVEITLPNNTKSV